MWDDDNDGLDEEDSLCGIWLDIRVEGDGLSGLGGCEEFWVLEEDGTKFGIVFIEGVQHKA